MAEGLTPEALLRRAFERNAYFRMPNAERREDEPDTYKKGYEVRLVLESADELAAVRSALEELDFKLAASFQHGRRVAQPIYGKKSVARFCEMLSLPDERVPSALPRSSP